MAFAVFLNAILGAAVVRTAAIGAVVVAIAVLLCKSDLRRSMNSVRGRSRSSLARRTRGAISGSTSATPASRFASSCVIAASSWSNRERLDTGTLHQRPKFLQSSKLKLFDCSFAAAHLLRNFPDALLLHEA